MLGFNAKLLLADCLISVGLITVNSNSVLAPERSSLGGHPPTAISCQSNFLNLYLHYFH